MIAHSFRGAEFGPAQQVLRDVMWFCSVLCNHRYMQLHGATYTVDVEIRTDELTRGQNWVMDIGKAHEVLGQVLNKYNFKNLNDVFPDENTTTEFMCKIIHRDLAEKLGCLDGKATLSVKLWESHKAWASFTDRV
jgi:6-pyruvoyl-tetrahydropterin synthase